MQGVQGVGGGDPTVSGAASDFARLFVREAAAARAASADSATAALDLPLRRMWPRDHRSCLRPQPPRHGRPWEAAHA